MAKGTSFVSMKVRLISAVEQQVTTYSLIFPAPLGILFLQTCLIIVNLFVSYKSKNKISARYYWESVCCCFFFLRFSRRFFHPLFAALCRLYDKECR